MPNYDSKNCDLDPYGRKREHSVYSTLQDVTRKNCLFVFLSSADYPDTKNWRKLKIFVKIINFRENKILLISKLCFLNFNF